MPNKAVWCKDCKYAKVEPYQGGIVCVNPNSDWRADYPPEYGSCEFCEDGGNWALAENENQADILEQAIGAFTGFIAFCGEEKQELDLTFDRLALQALQEKQEREKIQSECEYCNSKNEVSTDKTREVEVLRGVSTNCNRVNLTTFVATDNGGKQMRLIDADVLTEERVCNDPVVIAVKCAPTIEAVPAVHGRWIEKPNASVIVCSECKEPYFHAKKYDYNFCPSCGARMNEEAHP